MQRILFIFSLAFLLMASCNNKQADKASHQNTQGANEQTKVRATHTYRRYTGSISGQPVVVNLSVQITKTEEGKDGYAVFGSYYYPGKSQVIDLTLTGERMRGDSVRLTESTTANAEEPVGAIWDIQITELGIKGKWTSEDKKKTYDIDLIEQYEEGSYPFDVLDVKDSVVVQGKEDRYTMQTAYSLLVPTSKWNKENAQFAEQQILNELNRDTALGGQTVSEFIGLKNTQLFDRYRKTIVETLKREQEGVSFNNHSYSIVSTCDYNGRGMVVLALSTQVYTGGAHGGYWTRYICMDVRDRKVWKLADMIKVDTAALAKILDAKLRKSYDIKPGDKLSNTFLYDTIPPAENVSLSDAGITFQYNPYEIGAYVLGPVSVFIPFKELKGYLKPEFMKRWGI